MGVGGAAEQFGNPGKQTAYSSLYRRDTLTTEVFQARWTNHKNNKTSNRKLKIRHKLGRRKVRYW